VIARSISSTSFGFTALTATLNDGHIRGKRDQFDRVSAKAISNARAPADVDEHVAADRPAGLLHALNECHEAGLSFRVVRGRVHKHADASHAPVLLRARHQRPRRRAAEKGNELTSPHIRSQGQQPALYRLKRVLR
jgi:hypothetical protein